MLVGDTVGLASGSSGSRGVIVVDGCGGERVRMLGRGRGSARARRMVRVSFAREERV